MQNKGANNTNDVTIFSLFAFLWAMSMVWHYLRPENNYPVGVSDLFVVVMGILVMIRPHNVNFVAAMCFANVLIFLNAQPSASNHWMMQFLVNAVLSTSYIYLAIKRRTFRIDSSEWLEIFRPTVCALVLLLYAFASLHKLNSGYFSEHSYALQFYRDIAFGVQMSAFSHLFPMNDAVLAILPHISLLTELLIPILLFFKPTRVIGILLGMCFHVFLSFKEFPHDTDFPTLLGATYILFLPYTCPKVIKRSILTRIRESPLVRPVQVHDFCQPSYWP